MGLCGLGKDAVLVVHPFSSRALTCAPLRGKIQL